MNRKPFWSSTTVWLNVLVALLEIANVLEPVVTDPKVHGYILTGVAVVNVLIRVFKTSAPILAPDPKP